MRVVWILTGVLATAPACCSVRAEEPQSPSALVREVVYNELHDHDRHGYWRYWIEHHSTRETRVEEQVETSEGPIHHLVLYNGKPLAPEAERSEEERLNQLLSSPSEQASHRQAYAEDEKRIGRILALLPDAFLYQDLGDENGLRHLRFHPNPGYPPHSIEARIFHAMSGDLWVDSRMKHLARLSGRLDENVDFGFGLLGRLYKGGWFELERTQVSATDWKTDRLEVHMTGRAMLFKTIARETSEVRGGFEAVPPSMSLAQAWHVLESSPAGSREAAMVEGRPAPTSMRTGRTRGQAMTAR